MNKMVLVRTNYWSKLMKDFIEFNRDLRRLKKLIKFLKIQFMMINLQKNKKQMKKF